MSLRSTSRIRVAPWFVVLLALGCGDGPKKGEGAVAPLEDGGVLPAGNPPPAPTCSDGARGQTETDIDCGGGACPACAIGKACVVATDCTSGICQGNQCLPPASCSDGTKNGTETDVDCGGAGCAPCANGKACNAGTDCQVASCVGSVCQAATCTDTVTNANETDVDCGGSECAPCADGLSCAIASDCASSVCTALKCAAPACDDGVKNGSETGPDCGASCQACPPPDPSTVAPALARGATTSNYDSWSFLFTGANPIQAGVANGAIVAKRAALLRGKIRDRNGAAMPFVKVTILDHPEYGSTISRLDGAFDMVVNGGEALVLDFRRAGLISSQRRVVVPIQRVTNVDDVALVAYDGAVTNVDFAAPIQIARQNPVTDADGTRRATLFFKQGTTATMKLADGTTQPLTTVNVRATEYTVGASGERAMPGTLPPSSAYTYAVELSVDEAVNAGAVAVDFSKPVVVFLENFLGMPTGTRVPAGYYDRQRGAWIGSKNGRVIKVLDVASGKAEIDADGNGVAEDAAALAALDISDEERTSLATLYGAGQSLWRMPVLHFTPWDMNWPYAPPDDAAAPEDPYDVDDDHEECCDEQGSIIQVQNQGLGETIPIQGTPFSLEYRSRRAAPIVPKKLRLTGPTISKSLKTVFVEVGIAGQVFEATMPAAPNLTFTVDWDGKDVWGRPVFGTLPMSVSIGFTYEMVYKDNLDDFTAAFGLPSLAGVPLVRGRKEFTLWRTKEIAVRRYDVLAAGFGGWSLSAHHMLDATGGFIVRGDGRDQSTFPLAVEVRSPANARPTRRGPVLATVMADASLPSAKPMDFTVAPDGTVYWSDNRMYVNKIVPGGVKTKVAGTGIQGDYGDGGPATAAGVRAPRGLALGPDGDLYIGTIGSVRRIDRNGIISTVANIAAASLATAPDGTLFFSNGNSVRRLSRDGVLTTYAGGFANAADAKYPLGTSGVPANETDIYAAEHLSIGPDGSVWFSESPIRLRRITPDGMIRTVSTQYAWPNVRSDGTIVASGAGCAVYELTPELVPRKILGGGDCYTDSIDGTPGVGAHGQFHHPRFGVGEEVYAMGNFYPWHIRVLTSNPPRGASLVNDLDVVPSETGDLLFAFRNGRHLETLDGRTGASHYSYARDVDGRLLKVTDDSGLITTIERDSAGNPTAIQAPGGQRTALSVDANGYLSKVTRPDGRAWDLTTTAQGLLTKVVAPNGGVHTFQYDADYRLVKDTDPFGAEKALAREKPNSDLLRTTVTSPLGHATRYEIQTTPTGQTRVDTQPDGTTSTVVSDPSSKRVRTTAAGTVVTTTYKPDPRWGMAAPFIDVQSVALPSGLTSTIKTTRTVSSAVGNPLEVMTQNESFDVNGRTLSTSYDGSGRVVYVTSPGGLDATLSFDEKGRAIQEQIPGVQSIAREFGANGRLTKRTQGALTTTWAFDALRRVTSRTDGSATTQFTYDAADRVVKITLASGRAYEFGYGAGSQPTSVKMPNGSVHLLGQDAFDRVTSFAIAGGPSTSFVFDADRQRSSITYSTGRVLTTLFDASGRFTGFSSTETAAALAYDGVGRVSTVSHTRAGATQKLELGYDGGLLTSVEYVGSAAGKYTFGYDNDFALTSQTFDGATTTFSRNGDKRVSQIASGGATYSVTRAGPLGMTSQIADGGQLVHSIGYGADGRESTRTVTVGGTQRYSATLTYDALGFIASKDETVVGVNHKYVYTYDADGQLTKVDRDGAAFEQSTYDANGNRTQLVLNGTTESATYDAADRATTVAGASHTFDADGRMTARGSDTFVYGTRGELLSATVGGKTVTYTHDGWGRRVARTDDQGTTQYFYGATRDRITHVRRPGGEVTEFFYDESQRLFAFTRGAARYFVGTDQVGSPRIVIDSAGTVVKTIELDSFGRVLSDSNPSFDLEIGFSGGVVDPLTGLVRFGWRDYDTRAGRWTSQDPLRYAGKSFNLYRFARNHPVLLRDPDGLGVQRCSNPIDDWRLKILTLGVGRHYWLAAGGNHGGLVGDSVVGDHSGYYNKDTMCEDIDNVDEQCVASKIIPNVSPTPPWTGLTNCWTFANSVLNECSPGFQDNLGLPAP